MKIVILAVIIILFVILVWAVIENTAILKIRREDLGGKLKIAQISDLHKRHFGRKNSWLIKMTAKENPDLILLTGDIISRDETDFSVFDYTLRELNKIAPVYMIYGNHEQSLPPEFHDELKHIILNSGTYLLRNEKSKITINGEDIHVCGIEPKYTTYKKSGGYRNLDTVTPEDMKELLGQLPEGKTILMAHNPLFAESYADWGVKYTFSGHIHGGSFRLFGIPLLSPERKFFPKYSKGVFDVKGMKLCVSAGLGRLRLFDPAEIVIYNI